MIKNKTLAFIAASVLLLSACAPQNSSQKGEAGQGTEEEASKAAQSEMALVQSEEAESRNVENAQRKFEKASEDIKSASKEVDRASGKMDKASHGMEKAMEEAAMSIEGLRETAGGRDAQNPKSENQNPESRESRVSAARAAALSGQAPEGADEPGMDENMSLGNPIRQVDSPKEFEKIGLRLNLPDEEALYKDASFSIIGGQAAQIQFYDTAAGSDAIARAGKKENGDPSGIYYIFDEEKRENWSAVTDDGRLNLTAQVTVENSDVPGVLVSWENEGMFYTLWEDSARENTAAAVRTGMEIAKESSRKQ